MAKGTPQLRTLYTLFEYLYDYSTARRIGLATAEEIAESDAAAARDGGLGLFEGYVTVEQIFGLESREVAS